jgi:eukaryotic-like serine/threonine-protein kinase
VSNSRRAIEPPELAGYTYRSNLGSGGFADVFLYEREFPRQEVAIKVMDRLVGKDEGRARFVAEANAMASVSTHPFIVTIFHADVSPQNHPYLVMEYFPGANYSVRSKNERFSVAQVLRLGVQVASAVETAHQAGILHRDIKPANILTSAYGRPGLTDFGIASSLKDSGTEVDGLSIPWSPPEALDTAQAPDERSDIYSLAATLYTLLAGHSPFERPGESNRSIDLIDRIEREPLPEFERNDVPGSLYRLLAQAMAKQPAARPASAAEFARVLQAIEVEQRYDLTPLEVSADVHASFETQAIDADAGSTRIKGPTVVDGQSRFAAPSDTVARSALQRKAEQSDSAAPIRGVPFAVPKVAAPPPVRPSATPARRSEATRQPASASYSEAQPTPVDHEWAAAAAQPTRRLGTGVMIGIGAAVVAVVAVVVAVVLSGSSAVTAPTVNGWGPSPQVSSPGQGISGIVSWSLTPGGQGGDKYQVSYDGRVVANYVDGQASQGGSSCSPNSSNTGVSCTIPFPPNVQAPDPITVRRIRGGASASASANWSK